MKKNLLFAIGMISSIYGYAQNTKTAVVVDAQTKQPLAGAHIDVAGVGYTTNQNGEFTFSCSGDQIAKISFVGYKTLEQNLPCADKVVITMTMGNQNLDEVEVTATSNPIKSQLETPASIVKIKEQEIKRGTGIYMDDAINTNIPGVSMSRRANSSGQQLNIRGYGNGMGIRGVNSNFDIQGTKIYLNGIPVTDAEGISVMDDIDFGSISNVEIAKGPSGTLYGLAIAGVVNFTTQKAEKNKTSISQDFMAGSYGLLRSTSRISIGTENSSLLINYGKQKFDGFMDHTASTKDFVNVMGDFNLNEKQTLTTYLGWANSYDERNGELTVAQYDTLNYSGNPAYIKNNAHSAVRTIRAGIGHTYKFNDHISNTTSFFGSAQSMDNSSAGGWTDKYPVNYGIRSVFDKNFSLGKNISLSGITGIEAQKMNAQTIGYGMGADSTDLTGYNIITSVRSNQAVVNSTYSYFTQWTLKLPMDINVTAGVGISNMSISLTDRLWAPTNNHPNATKLPLFEASYKNLVSPNFALNKKFNDKFSVYASYSIGYKAPVSSNILISTTGQVNTGLIPEKGTQIEVGTKGSLLDNKLYYTVAAFNVKFDNKFSTVAVPNPANTVTLYSYIVNSGTLNNSGVEALVKYSVIDNGAGFFKSVRPFANLTLSNFKYENFAYQRIGKDQLNKDSLIIDDYSGKVVAGVSPLVYNLGVDFDTKVGLYGNVTYSYKGAMYYTSDNLYEADAYALLNAKIGYRKSIKKFDLDVYAGANNITGTQYYNMLFVNQLPDTYIPGPNEINFFGGVNLKYNF